MENMTELIDT